MEIDEYDKEPPEAGALNVPITLQWYTSTRTVKGQMARQMTTEEVAKDLVQLCRQGKFEEATEKHYAGNVVSVEATDGPMAVVTGLDAVKGKSQWWVENHEVHGLGVAGPYVNGDQFIVEFEMDITFKPTGHRTAGKETGLYTVADGKVVREVFFPAVS